MIRVLTVKQMQDADKYTIEQLGIPSETLIERAGEAVYNEIEKRYHGGRVLVCIGVGNNGRDGEIIAKLLSNKHGFKVTVCYIAQDNLAVLDKKYDIIVDCIFGTGLNREVAGEYKTAIEKINKSNSVVVSCDIPSGLNGDTGLAMGVAVQADLTIAIQEYKLGHFLNDGLDYCGEIIVKDIGISIWDDDFINVLSNADAKKYFPKRKRNSHKGRYGKVAIIGGSKDYSGSAMLSLNSLTALKMGVGYSTLYVPESLFSVYAGVYPECIIRTISDQNGFVVFDENKLEESLTNSVIAIGMGIGVSEEVYKIIAYYLQRYSGTLIIDADGLNSLSKYGVDVLKDKNVRWY
ncbi:MAG: NAD(P)H-hydrate epimerase [Clostridiales bacterium]|nr:NAD(P)H-hydrate epimerase [Clostridiales bacterium]